MHKKLIALALTTVMSLSHALNIKIINATDRDLNLTDTKVYAVSTRVNAPPIINAHTEGVITAQVPKSFAFIIEYNKGSVNIEAMKALSDKKVYVGLYNDRNWDDDHSTEIDANGSVTFKVTK